MLVKRIIFFCIGAIALFPALVNASSCSSDKNFVYANQLVEQEAYTDAVAVYETVLKHDPVCMAAKLELGFCHIHLGNYTKATQVLQEVRRVTLLDKESPEAAKIRQLIDTQLAQIPQLREGEQQRADNVMLIQKATRNASPQAQLSVGLGLSDNINGGVQFDELTFGQGDASITSKLGEENKAHHGTWFDLEVAGQRRVPTPEGLEGNLHVIATWRDARDADESSVNNGEFDLGTLRGMLEVKPSGEPSTLDPRLVLSGGGFFLDSAGYRDDMAVGGRISQDVADRKVTLGYQFADHNYRSIDNTDGRYHRASLAIPLIPETGEKKVRVNVDFGYQWPESTDRLGDYRETSGKLRLSLEPMPQSELSLSYSISKQQDAAAYNREFFGEAKRNIEQRALNIGWSMAVEKDLSLEANLQRRRRYSDVKLFEHTATDLTVGFRWELN